MRTELERFLTSLASKQRAAEGAPAAAAFERGVYEAVKRGLEVSRAHDTASWKGALADEDLTQTGPAPLSHPRVQSEMSHFTELQRSSRAAA